MQKGADTRNSILAKGLEMASQYGLENVTIGSLAKTMCMSKSGIFGHFQSKENLQIQIINFAVEHFTESVIVPSLKVTRGIPRIKAMVDNWISWGTGSAGGCIFVLASNEFSNRPGAVREVLLVHQKAWLEGLAKLADSAKKADDFRQDVDISQFAFELYSLMLGFHYYHRMMKDTDIQKKQDRALTQLINNYT